MTNPGSEDHHREMWGVHLFAKIACLQFRPISHRKYSTLTEWWKLYNKPEWKRLQFSAFSICTLNRKMSLTNLQKLHIESILEMLQNSAGLFVKSCFDHKLKLSNSINLINDYSHTLLMVCIHGVKNPSNYFRVMHRLLH